MTTQLRTALALKEWAVLIDALATGRQAIVLRKGGIHEKTFLVEGHSFYLLPTFEHQSPDLLKPDVRGGIDHALAGERDEAGLVVRARADLAGFWEIDDEARVGALRPFHIYTDEFVEKRFNWRPKQPLTVMLLRTYRLEQPWHTGLPVGVGGCRSWLELDETPSPLPEVAAIDDGTFDRLVGQLNDTLG